MIPSELERAKIELMKSILQGLCSVGSTYSKENYLPELAVKILNDVVYRMGLTNKET